jgi:GTP-binding protein Era
VALLIVDVNENWEECNAIFEVLKLRVPALVVINKIDRASQEKIAEAKKYFEEKAYCKGTITISASSGINIKNFLKPILQLLPEGEPFYAGDDISDLPTKFFVSELIREKIFENLSDEIPYHTAVLIREYKEKITLVKIVADIIVHRETQKAIIIGDKGSMIKKLGTQARKDIEAFLQQKVFLELFVKVKPKWRENEMQLKEYGY